MCGFLLLAFGSSFCFISVVFPLIFFVVEILEWLDFRGMLEGEGTTVLERDLGVFGIAI